MKTLGYIYASVVAVLLLASSCTDIVEVDKVLAKENTPSTGAPVIERIVLATEGELPITTAAFEQVVRIEGSNLGDLESLKFNDIEVNLKETYSSYEAILAPIPRKLPLEVTNMVYITTANGSSKASLAVTVPELTIGGLYNEFAQPGDTTIISGDNFDLYGITAEAANIRLGDTPINLLAASRTHITLQIPANARSGARLSIQGSEMREPVYLTYADEGASQLFDFNNWPGSGAYTHSNNYPNSPKDFLYKATNIVEGEDPAPLADGMNYVRFEGTVRAWGWMVLRDGHIDVPQEVVSDLASYDLRFEMNTSSAYPISSAARFVLGEYVWEPAASGVPINTYGKWMTARIPVTSKDGDGHQLIPDGTSSESRFSFKIIFSPSSEQVFDVSFCNFRFVKR